MGEINALVLTREESSRVAKPLAAVNKICAAGHTVVFDDDGSYVHNKFTVEVNMLRVRKWATTSWTSGFRRPDMKH